MELKKCTRCGEVLPLEKMQKNKRSKDGRGTWCKQCMADWVLNYYHANPKYRASVIAKTKQWIKNHPEKHKEHYNKAFSKYAKTHRAKISASERVGNYLTSSGLREILWKRAEEHCELCGTKLRRSREGSNYAIHHLDGDRNNNAIDNLIIVCTKCHLHKLHSHKTPRQRYRYNSLQ